jgi:hypothetical protein
MRIMKPAVAALFAVLACSAMAASSASAFHPLFLTQSAKELLFSGEGLKPVLRAEEAGVPGTLECERVLIDGFALNLSTLAHDILVLFEGKCTLKVQGGGNEPCREPLVFKKSLAELGLLTSTNHKVVLLLVSSEGTIFDESECSGLRTTVSGSIIAEIPENNAKLEKQINVSRSELEVVFATVNKNNQQAITEIWLLGTQMTGDELKVEGFFGGKAAEELTLNLKGDGKVEISTTKL